MQPLHNHDNRRFRAVFTRFQRVLKPIDNVLPSDFASCFISFVQIVQYDCAAESLAVLTRAETCNRTACTCCVHHTARRRFPVMAAFACKC